MTRTEIIEKLREKGYEFEKTEIVKNGVTKKAITPIGNEKVKPVIYTDYITENTASVEDAADSVILVYKNAVRKDLSSVTEMLEKPEILCKNLRIILQKHEYDTHLRRQTIYDGIDAVMVTEIEAGEETGMVKINRSMPLPKSEEEMWRIAEENTFREFDIFPMSEVLPEDMQSLATAQPFWVITNKEKHMGAAQALNVKAISKWAKSKDINSLIMIPCSVHEFIATPGDKEVLEGIGKIVAEVNRDVVEEEERLADNAYVLKIE